MKKIMLVDKVTEIAIKEDNPSTKAIISNNGEFDIVASPEQLEGYYVKPFSGNSRGKLVPMAQYIALQGGEFIKPLVPSELYENVYFEVANFEQQYLEAYGEIVKAFNNKLGGGSKLSVRYKGEKLESYQKEQESSIEAQARVKIVEVGASGKASEQESREASNIHTKEATATSLQPKCSVDEIKRWLEQEKINVEALPSQLKIIIKEFLDRGCLQYCYEEKESISSSISATQTSMFNMQLKLNTLPLSLKTSLNNSIQEASTQSTATEVYLCIECKHDGQA
ncbi:hypothetical protein [Helicobacter canis]|uniref:hypothetical protein n=1 Tax=Helicobacter canis TaxID=29419 RepID=UPI0026F184B3|nr:hypothetical protein [Helicobacter canis]